MKRFLLLSIAVFLAACTDTTGLSKESSRTPAGNPAAAVVVSEYADIQCPACQAAHASIVKPILEQYGDKIRYEFNHFPLRSIHRFALDAAEASECAADQGKFWEYIDVAYERQGDLSFAALTAWAEELGLDTQLFERCWKSHIKRDAVLADYSRGRDLDVNGTPTFFVQGVRVESGVDTIGAAIEQALGAPSMPL